MFISVIATVVTFVVTFILLKFLKPTTEKETKVYEDYEKAKKDLFDAIVKSLKIEIFLVSLNTKLERVSGLFKRS